MTCSALESLVEEKKDEGRCGWFGRVCVEGKKDLWDRKGKKRVRMGGNRARESHFVVLRFPKGQYSTWHHWQ